MTSMRSRSAIFSALLAASVVTLLPQPSLARKPHYFGAVPDTTVTAASGVPLREVRPRSPAEQAGLQAGDILVKLGSFPIRSVEDLESALQFTLPGKPIEIIYIRQGQEHRTEAALEPRR